MRSSIAIGLDRMLLDEALQAAESSQPHSKSGRKLGCALLAQDGRVYQGSYFAGATGFSTLHAELTAVACARMANGGRVKAVALYLKGNERRWPLPCGSCLQLLMENAEDSAIPVLASNQRAFPSYERLRLVELYPRPWLK